MEKNIDNNNSNAVVKSLLCIRMPVHTCAIVLRALILGA